MTAVTVVEIPADRNGPPNSGNGGYSAGVFAASVEPAPAVEVTLRKPPPLQTPLTMVAIGDGVEARTEDGTVIAQARPAALDLGVLPVPPADQVDALTTPHPAWGPDEHPFPTCYVCGPARSDGLGLAPRLLDDTSVRCATRWRPQGPAGDPVAGPETWAALDCPSYFPLMDTVATAVLGRITVEILEDPVIGEDHVLSSWRIGSEGRKAFGGSAIFRDGRLCARALAVWIKI